MQTYRPILLFRIGTNEYAHLHSVQFLFLSYLFVLWQNTFETGAELLAMALAHISWLKDGGGLPPEDDLCRQCKVSPWFSLLPILVFVVFQLSSPRNRQVLYLLQPSLNPFLSLRNTRYITFAGTEGISRTSGSVALTSSLLIVVAVYGLRFFERQRVSQVRWLSCLRRVTTRNPKRRRMQLLLILAPVVFSSNF